MCVSDATSQHRCLLPVKTARAGTRNIVNPASNRTTCMAIPESSNAKEGVDGMGRDGVSVACRQGARPSAAARFDGC